MGFEINCFFARILNYEEFEEFKDFLMIFFYGKYRQIFLKNLREKISEFLMKILEMVKTRVDSNQPVSPNISNIIFLFFIKLWLFKDFKLLSAGWCQKKY